MRQEVSFRPYTGKSRTGGQKFSRREIRRAKQRRAAAAAACTALGIGLAVLLGYFVSGAAGLHASASYGTAEYDLSSYVFDAADPRLVLVNNNLPLPEDYTPGSLEDDPDTGKQLAAEAAQAYQQMRAAAKQDGVSLVLCSGYRDYAYQAGLFARREEKYRGQGLEEQQAAALAQTVVAKPGCSEHQTGFAADIVTQKYTSLDSGFADTDAFAWLQRYAADYGWILRYPQDRQRSTGIIYEPWHWRYVGVENARAIEQSGLSLEEFMALHITAADAALAAQSAAG